MEGKQESWAEAKQENWAEGRKEIKSIKQIADHLQHSRREFQNFMHVLNVSKLSAEEDLSKKHPTLQTIIEDLPKEPRLKQMLDHQNAVKPEKRQSVVSAYKGNYETIKKAGENYTNLKAEAEKIYYLAAEQNFQKLKSPEEHEGTCLKSEQVSSDDHLKVSRFEKNTISPTYIRQLRAEKSKDVTHPSSPDFLNLSENCLLFLSLYDSINGEKVFQYVCHSDQTLLEVVSQFYCLIGRLEGKEQSQHLNSYCLIEQNLYYNGSQTRRKIEDIANYPAHEPMNIFEQGKVKLKNLRVVFGRPYLYRHLEGCDHVFIFKDLQLLGETQPTLPLKRDKYPLVVFEGRMRRRKCEGCKGKFAEWVSLNDPLKQGKHLYLCTACHHNLHSEPKGEPQVFIPYLHD